MRVQGRSGHLTALAVSGTHVVMIGMSMPKSAMKTCLGFAIMRKDQESGESVWMRGQKYFAGSALGDAGAGQQFTSREHPFQSFQWSDYSAKPAQAYTYRIVAMHGQPGALTEGAAVSLKIKTQSVKTGKHTVFFNRGAAASQEYARRFKNVKPNELEGDEQAAAYKWLSRGLVEGLVAFLREAGAGDSLFGAIYQYQNSQIFSELKAARSRGARVQVMYDGKGMLKANVAAVAEAKARTFSKPRSNTATIAHNKFFVLVKKGKPAAVWTGSTNLTENGIYGHSNLGHIVRDEAIAQAYYDYYLQINADMPRKELASWTLTASPAPVQLARRGMVPVFSPRKGTDLEALQWYADMASQAQRGLFGTFAFGMHERFLSAYDKDDHVLKFALMESLGATRAGKAAVSKMRRRPNIVVAVGNAIQTNAFDNWLEEITSIVDKTHVRYIHTKYILVDPLGDDPIVVSGSANFSKASTDSNDENMLVIRGEKDLADIFLGEFMRLYSHYAYREMLARKRTGQRSTLVPTSDWINEGYFEKNSQRSLRRQYFAGVKDN